MADQKMQDAKTKTEAYLAKVWSNLANVSFEKRRTMVNNYVTKVATEKSWRQRYTLLTDDEVELCDMIVSSGFRMLKMNVDMKTGDVKIEIILPKAIAAPEEPDELEKMVDAIEGQYRKNK